jgi:hypothetical protein
VDDGARPCSLIVGPDPESAHDSASPQLSVSVRTLWYKVSDWVTGAYEGRRQRLCDYVACRQWLEVKPHVFIDAAVMVRLHEAWQLTAADRGRSERVARSRKENMIRWTSEVQDHLRQPVEQAGLLLAAWVRGGDADSMHERMDVVVDIWGTISPANACRWAQQMPR